MATSAEILAASCLTEIRCADEQKLLVMLAQLLANGTVGPSCANVSGVGSPVGVVTPCAVGQFYTQADGGPAYWESTGLTSTDWTMRCSPVNGIYLGADVPKVTVIDVEGTTSPVTAFSAVALTDAVTIDLSIPASLASFSAPALVNVASALKLDNAIITSLSLPSLEICGTLSVSGLSNCTSISIPVATFIGFFSCGTSPLLTSLLVPNATFTGPVYFDNCPSLTTLVLTNAMFTDGNTISGQFSGLNQASVDLVLRRAVVSGMTSGNVLLDGGTNATPSAAGLADASILTLAGVTVSTN